jgi:nucleoporin NUP159
VQEVGFKGVDRDCRIRFLPTPWPVDAQPPPTCSLMTVASRTGVVVAGGPDCLVIAKTESVREAISAETEEGVKVKPFEPQVKIPLLKRPMQVAFCFNENALAVSIEGDDQVLVYDTATLLQGNPQLRLMLPTNGAPLRQLAPNPSTEATNSGYIAMVTTGGDLLIGDINESSLVSGPRGPILKDIVSCVSWSNKGKQLVAGLTNGTCHQMTPTGDKKDEIPRPPDLDGNQHGKSTHISVPGLNI